MRNAFVVIKLTSVIESSMDNVICSRCDEKPADLECVDCLGSPKFCSGCSAELHSKGKWKTHHMNPLHSQEPPTVVIATIESPHEEQTSERKFERGSVSKPSAIAPKTQQQFVFGRARSVQLEPTEVIKAIDTTTASPPVTVASSSPPVTSPASTSLSNSGEKVVSPEEDKKPEVTIVRPVPPPRARPVPPPSNFRSVSAQDVRTPTDPPAAQKTNSSDDLNQPGKQQPAKYEMKSNNTL